MQKTTELKRRLSTDAKGECVYSKLTEKQRNTHTHTV